MFGIVAPLGTHLDRVENFPEQGLRRFGYATNKLRLSDLARNFQIDGIDVPTPGKGTEYERISALMSVSNALRERSGQGEFLALTAAQRINSERADEGGGARNAPRLRTAHVIRSLKHPEEVLALRRIYGTGFFLIGVTVAREERVRFLKDDKNCDETQIEELLRHDEHEEERRDR